MTLTKEQMIERAKEWKRDSAENYQGHYCAEWDFGWIDNRGQEFDACLCTFALPDQYKEQSNEQAE
jgi:hypothetical protein